MKNLTNILLILLIILVLGFTGIVIFNIFTPPKPKIPTVSQPIEETTTPEPEPKIIPQPKTETQQADVGAGLVPAQAGPGLVPAQTLRIQSLIAKITSNNVEEALKAEDELVKIGKPALKELVNTLNNLEPAEDILRPEIAFLLGRFEDKEAVPALISLLENENSYIRRNAVDSLGRIRGREAVPSLIAKLSDEDESVRESAISALGEIRSYESTEDLINRLKDENETAGVKLAAVKALAQIKDTRASEELLKQLKNESEPFYKDEVVDSLANIGDKQAVPGLNEYLDQLKNNKPEDTGDLFPWQNSMEIAEQAIQRLTMGFKRQRFLKNAGLALKMGKDMIYFKHKGQKIKTGIKMKKCFPT